MAMDPSKHKCIRLISGLVSVGLATFIVMLALMPPVGVASVTTFPLPPFNEPDSTDPPIAPPPYDPYCLFPGEGKHMGFGNGFGRAGARFLCEVARAVGLRF